MNRINVNTLFEVYSVLTKEVIYFNILFSWIFTSKYVHGWRPIRMYEYLLTFVSIRIPQVLRGKNIKGINIMRHSLAAVRDILRSKNNHVLPASPLLTYRPREQ